MPLTFERFKVWEVVVPVRADILVAHDTGHSVYSENTSWPELSIFLVEAQTSAGFTAVGEAGRGETRANVENTLRGLLGVDLSTTSASTLWMEEQAGLARRAYRRFGKGRGHPAGLNYGDCFSFALAEVTGEPLLFKGDDFSRTGLSVAPF